MDTEWLARVQTLQSLPYAEYLQTPEWLAKREQALRLAEHRCQVCYSTNELHVHHRTYERRGCEALGDLTALCSDCHALYHGKQQIPSPDEETEPSISEMTLVPSDTFSLANLTFETFQPVSGSVVEAFLLVGEYAVEPSGTLVVHGPCGTGKTHMVVAICHHLYHSGIASTYVSAPTLFLLLQEGGSNSLSILQQVISTPFLVIDDLSMARRTGFREEIYFTIIDERTKRGRPMALVLNHIDDLESCLGEKCMSRLEDKDMGGTVICETSGEDYRRRAR